MAARESLPMVASRVFQPGRDALVAALLLLSSGTMSFAAAAIAAVGTADDWSKQPVKVACVGASITQGMWATPDHDYPTQLQEMLGPGFHVGNFGRAGTTALHKGRFLNDRKLLFNERAFGWSSYQLTGEFKKALAFKPDIVVIQFGANDSKDYNWGMHSQEMKADVEDLIHNFETLDSHPKVYLMLPPPLYHDGMYGMNATVIRQALPSVLIEVTKSKGLPPPVDVLGAFLERCPIRGSWEYCDLMSADGCHPNDAGYHLLAEVVQAAITATE
mmetsp:Transcript_54109/g.125866  ORF Transcript_54109/g.125866 Transcript_54109/m.125866 type:complete len:274 (+) Transcript_54109:116-937(+)